ncbi:protein Diedel-like [Drosophila madeirensis]|uniref:Protein Diedel-like n=1 Tax=Drosophila madeirensis TaxID=30013 RepID=A0AAU9EWG7_DROMD
MQAAISAATPLLIAVCWLCGIGNASAECCKESLTLHYSVLGSTCGSVGGRNIGGQCSITICGDGKPLEGTFCGQSPCNVFGCECAAGCLLGNWKESFLQRNSDQKIEIADETWNNGVIFNFHDFVHSIPIPNLNLNIG